MKQLTANIYFLGLAPILLVYANGFTLHQRMIASVHTARIDTTSDSASFSPNKEGGWDTLAYYINQDTPDSVQFELVVRHSNDIAWTEEHFIGTIIDSTLKPLNSQHLEYQFLIDNNWTMRIEPNGQCFLMQLNGPAFTDDPVIFPIRVRYKNN